MRKIILLLSVLAFTSVASVHGATFTEGYYRIQNVMYGNPYLALLDDTGSVTINGSGIANSDLFAIRMLFDNEANNIMSNPATVVHIYEDSANPGKYICSAQGVSTKDLTSYPFLLDEMPRQGVGFYRISATRSASHTTVVLNGAMDRDDNDEYEDSGHVATKSSNNSRYWYIHSVQSGTDQYFGFSPKLHVNGKYYQTFYAEFPFRIVSSGVKVYYVSDIWRGNAVIRQVADGTVVPAATPVFVECSSSSSSSNQVQPVLQSATALSGNLLRGVYFRYYYCPEGSSNIHNNRTAFDPNTMRVLRVTSDGTLAFVSNPSEAANGTYYLPANEAYLTVPAGTAAVLPVITYSEYVTGIKNAKADATTSSDDAVYTINGVRVYNTKTLPHGIYIKGGRKVVK